jgi:hypothetical protein
MTARKTQPTTEPVVRPDEAFANILAEARDNAVAEESRLRSQQTSLEETYRRDEARRKAAYDAEWNSLDGQVARQAIIASVATDALEDMATRYAPEQAPSNVVPLRQAGE